MSTPNSISGPVDFSKPIDTAGLKGKSIIVTGGATGIGEGIVRALAAAGAFVTLADINTVDGEKVVSDLKEKRLSAQFIHSDVTSWSSQLALFDSAVSNSPSKTIDIVIPCAGIAGHRITQWLEGPPTDPDTGDLLPPPTKVLDLNLTAVYYTTHLALHYFKKSPETDASPSKQIIFIGSLAGISPPFLSSDYGPSKFAVRGLWKSIRGATDILGQGKPKFRTNLIAPTFVLTPMTAPMKALIEKAGLVFAHVDDVVEGVLRLASNEEIYGRALAIAPEKNIIDIGDDKANEAGSELAKAVSDGVFGPGFKSYLK